MKHWSWCLAVTFFSSGILLAEEQSCVFDKSGVKPPLLSKEIAEFQKLDEQNNEARFITKDGVYIYIKYWGCDHYGKSIYVTMPFNLEMDFKDNIVKYAKYFLDGNDVSLISSGLKNVEDEKLYAPINIKGSQYSEFYVRLYDLNNLVTINISYSGN